MPASNLDQLDLNLLDVLSQAIRQTAPQLARPISQWVEQEIVIPTGQYAGNQYRHSRHPVSRIWFRELDRNYWWRHAVVAPTQNGKTFMGYVIPVVYHLFELGETVIVGLPDMRMADDKWQMDFLPVIEASRYRDLLPSTGEGSRSGKIKSAVRFLNGAILRFMSAGGRDKARAGFPGCRVVAITETDGMDEAGENSREADKCKQIEARTRNRPAPERRAYLECTASIPEGKIWNEYTHGTKSKIMRPCPHCQAWVCPERANLKGWQDAPSEEDARERAAWHCPSCDHAWTQADREWGWERAVLVHDGQEVTPEGEIVGVAPKTRTLGFRWGPIDNPFTSAGDCGAEEWRAAHDKDTKKKEGYEREICQWTNATPFASEDVTLIELGADDVESAAVQRKRGIIPAGTVGLTIGIDTHARILYWEAKAIVLDADGSYRLHVFDHSTLKLDATQLAREAIIRGLRILKKQFDAGWLDESGKTWTPSQVWIDSSYAPHQIAVYKFCVWANRDLPFMGEVWRPAKGHGEGQLRTTPYRAPNNKAGNVIYVGNDYWISRPKQGKTEFKGVQLVHVNADTWKTAVYEGFTVKAGEDGTLPAGAITLFEESGPDRAVYSAQICGEIPKEKTVKDRGKVMVWVYVSANHWLDCAYLSTAAADFVVVNRERLGGAKRQRKNAGDYSARPQPGASPYASRPVAGVM
ncbi:MAG: phage terminase large subunit family protein [Planctomycetota bacterium]|nr:phage terminase large subunit family protein [Planctomycetota bacterium]